MGDLVSSSAVINGLREAAGRCWWGEIGLDDKNPKRYSVHYGDLIRSGHGWRARRIEGSPLRDILIPNNKELINKALDEEDALLRGKLLSALKDIYGEEASNRANEGLGNGSLRCRRVRKVVDDIRQDKEFFQQKFFLSRPGPPLPGTFNALLCELYEDPDIPKKFWGEMDGVNTLRNLANKIIDRSEENLSEATRFWEIRENIKEFFAQRQTLQMKANALLNMEHPIIQQDMPTLFDKYLLHPSVIQLLPEGARGELMEGIWVRYCQFLELRSHTNPVTKEARESDMTKFIFGKPDMPKAFNVTGSFRYRNPFDSLRSPDRGVHHTIVPIYPPRSFLSEEISFNLPVNPVNEEKSQSLLNKESTKKPLQPDPKLSSKSNESAPQTMPWQMGDEEIPIYDDRDFYDAEVVYSKDEISDMLSKTSDQISKERKENPKLKKSDQNEITLDSNKILLDLDQALKILTEIKHDSVATIKTPQNPKNLVSSVQKNPKFMGHPFFLTDDQAEKSMDRYFNPREIDDHKNVETVETLSDQELGPKMANDSPRKSPLKKPPLIDGNIKKNIDRRIRFAQEDDVFDPTIPESEKKEVSNFMEIINF